ncbi:hypothetical protein Esti_001461 [Eimeria stiedai]
MRKPVITCTPVIGGFEGELYTEITHDDFLSGRCFTTASTCCNVALNLPRASSSYATPLLSSSRTLLGPQAIESTKPEARPQQDPCGMTFFLQGHLRQHQLDGLTWMHERIAGGGGCILADSMGLGKTLQAIALLCALVAKHTQRPNSPPFRSLIVCPTSLKGNWKNGLSLIHALMVVPAHQQYLEFKKWLGNRIPPLLSSGDTRQISDMMQTFACSTRNQTLISSYEDIRRVEIPCIVDLLICDEGHRLRSLRSQTSLQLQKIKSKRRLLLTGVCAACTIHLDVANTQPFQGLPFKIICRIVNTPETFAARQLDIAALVKASLQDDAEGVTHEQKKANVEPGSTAKIHPGLREPSNKIAVLMHIMRQLQGDSPEKVVVVSNSTAVLDCVGSLFKKRAWSSLRLDGSTPEAARTDLVEKFNKDPTIQAFLLSSKAGGIGLNLTGANRLIHFDPDWNPANDQQALSRIWRDGQTEPVFIYRLTGAGTVESHIIRRQLFKNSLAKTFVDGREGSSGRWTAEHIADILTTIKGELITTYYEQHSNDEVNEGGEQVESFIPLGSALPPQWLEGFHLSEASLLLRKIELEDRPECVLVFENRLELMSSVLWQQAQLPILLDLRGED